MNTIKRIKPMWMLRALLIASITVSGWLAADDSGITVSGVWMRALPAVSRVNSAYMVIQNAGQQDDRLVAASTEIAEIVEIHISEMKDGVAGMRRVDGVDIPAGQRVELRSGGYHLMLKELKQAPAMGERVPFTLVFEHAGKVMVHAQVLHGAPMGSEQAGHDSNSNEHVHE